MLRASFRTALLAGTILAAASAAAHDPAQHAPGTSHQAANAAASSADAPLLERLGAIHFPISTKDPQAQRYFDQGLALAYGFNHWEAQRSFRAAQALDPACAMCFWGEALVLGPNINAPMDAAANEPALAAIAEARRLAPDASEKEQALIAALASRYSADPAAERSALDLAYADAMQEVARKFPDDLDVATLYAESIMDLSPWNYWADGGTMPKGRTAELVATLEKVLAANPDHIGAIHLYIHAVEASDRPERAEPYADRLAAQNVSAGHLAHMPSHIYYRLGRYKDSLELNKAAVAADEAYLAEAKPEGFYSGTYYPHNIHFVLVSAQMAGEGTTAIEAAEKLGRSIPDEIARVVPWIQPVKAAPLFAHTQFSAAETVLALPSPGDDFPYVKAMWHYARGTAHAGAGDSEAARAEAEAIAAIGRSADFSGLTSGGVPAPDLLELARHVVLARVAQAEGNLDKAIAEFEAAAALEKALPYMEPPFWYYPVEQSLGAVLLQAGQTDRAEEVFRQSLVAAPNNGWACFGLLQVHKTRGDAEQTSIYEARLGRSWTGDPALLDLNRL
jgi:tetratricopeptide (TPR) repeat protein